MKARTNSLPATLAILLTLAACKDSPDVAAAADTLTGPGEAGALKLAATERAPAELCPRCPDVWDGPSVNRYVASNSASIEAQRSWLADWRELEELHGPGSAEALYPRELLLRELHDTERLLSITPQSWVVWISDAANDEPLAETAKRLRGWLDR